MEYIHRFIESKIRESLDRGKGVLLLGPRQTGKTTLIEKQINPDISYTFAKSSIRQRYEQNPTLLEQELEERIQSYSQPPIVFIDEVQKIPAVMDIAQYLLDKKLAKMILTGSSARKLKTGKGINLLPGRVVSLNLSPFLYEEIKDLNFNLEELLLYGTLPGIILEKDNNLRETDLRSYITTYLEEEVRAEALVRNVGQFSRFLEIAAGESGKQLNFTRLSQDIGVADTTIKNYFQILEDCLIAHRIDPITNSQTKRRLIKSPKYLFFDLGVRRTCANEGTKLPQRVLGDLFEHLVGNELINRSQLSMPPVWVKYWRDTSGMGIDYVLDFQHQYIPIEVKWSDKPQANDAKHLMKFINEHSQTKQGYIVCRTPHRYKITDNITALPWQEINLIFNELNLS